MASIRRRFANKNVTRFLYTNIYNFSGALKISNEDNKTLATVQLVILACNVTFMYRAAAKVSTCVTATTKLFVIKKRNKLETQTKKIRIINE